MVEAFNALLSCLVTGLFTAIFMAIGAHFGILPMIIVMPKEEDEFEEDEDEQ